MDATGTTAVPTLLFDGTSVETAAASAVQALVALQQMLAKTPGKNPMSPMSMVQMAAAATKLSMVPPTALPCPADMYNPALNLTFDLARGRVHLTVPAIGPAGAGDEARVVKGSRVRDDQVIDIFSRLWLGMFRHLEHLAGH